MIRVFSIAVLVAVCGQLPEQSSLSAEKEELAGQIALLKGLTGDVYLEHRDKILQQDDIVRQLEDMLLDAEDWHTAVLCESLIYRKKHPDMADLLDRWWGQYEAFRDGGPGWCNWHGVVIRNHFGDEAGPLIAEQVIHTWRDSQPKRLSALRALMIVHYRYLPQILGSIAANETEPFIIRYHALNGIRRCFEGLHAYEVDPEHPAFTVLGSLVAPEALASLRQNRTIPTLELEDAQYDLLVTTVFSLLEDQDELLRAGAVRSLRFAPEEKAVPALAKRLQDDDSAWIRAISANALRALDTEDARFALRAALETEENEDVIEVIEGRRVPVRFISSVPESILQPEVAR